jgi:RNA polymerase primary sigma factor
MKNQFAIPPNNKVNMQELREKSEAFRKKEEIANKNKLSTFEYFNEFKNYPILSPQESIEYATSLNKHRNNFFDLVTETPYGIQLMLDQASINKARVFNLEKIPMDRVIFYLSKGRKDLESLSRLIKGTLEIIVDEQQSTPQYLEAIRNLSRYKSKLPGITHLILPRDFPSPAKLMRDIKEYINQSDKSISKETTAFNLGYIPKELPKKIRDLTIEYNKYSNARRNLIEGNLRLVIKWANKNKNRGVPFIDLIQEGNSGLMHAADKFNHNKGNRFSTYATPWIRQRILRAVDEQAKTVRMPGYLEESLRNLNKTTFKLSQNSNSTPSLEEISQEMGIETDEVIELIKYTKKTLSLNVSYQGKWDGDISPTNLINPENVIAGANPVQEPEIPAHKQELSEKLAETLETLTPRARAIMVLRYGLKDGQIYTLEEIGRIFKVSRERIRQIEAKSLKFLQNPNRSKHLSSFIDSY